MKVVVADAGPLIIFALTGNFYILEALFKHIIVPFTVYKELATEENLPGAKILKQQVDKGYIKVEKLRESYPETLFLDDGEAEAISLALKNNMLLMIDEKRGRQVANKCGIKFFGSGRVLIAAKKKNIIDSPQKIMNQFISSGYRISDRLYKKIMILCKD